MRVEAGIAQDIQLSGNYRNVNLHEVIDDLETKYPVKFYYQQQWLPENKLDIQFDNWPIHQVLDSLLFEGSLSYMLYGSDKIILAHSDRLKDLQPDRYFAIKQATSSTGITNQFPVVSIGDSSTVSLEALNAVKLTVSDFDEGDRLSGVAIYVTNLDLTYNTDSNGEVVAELPGGIHQLELRRIGYQPYFLNIKVYSKGESSLRMEPEAIELQEVVVSGENPGERLLSPQSGVVALTPKDIKEMPVFLGEADIIKTIQTIPGVTTIGEGAPGFFVRGGNADQNLILQDEVIFTNSSHALGFFSLFNPDLISQVRLYKGSIPAQYGGRLSSILDVQLKGNNYNTTVINGGVGTVMSKLAIEAPLIKDKVSILAGGRISYADWLLPVVKIPEVRDSEAFFYDFNVKLSSRISDKGSIGIGYFQSFDRVNFQDEAGFEWAIKGFSLDWNQGIGKSVQSEFKAAWGQTENLNFDPTGLDLTELRNGLQFFKLKEIVSIPLNKHNLLAGAEWIYYQPEDEVLTTIGTLNEEDRLMKDLGQELGFFLNDEWEVNNKLALSLGLRASLFMPEEVDETEDDEQFINVEPRVSLRYGLSRSSSIKASYNRMSQYIHLLSNTTGILPTDQWILSNSMISPSTSDNFSVGYFKNFDSNEWEASAEVFYRLMNDLIEYKDFADLILNPNLEDEIIQGDGEAYGLEIFLKRHLGKVKGNVSYTYSRTFIEAPVSIENDDLIRFPARFDRPHSLNLVMDWTVNRKSKFGLVFNFTSGRPISAPESSYSLGNVVVPNYSDRNEYRIPSYHRLDLSYTYKRNAVKKKRYQDSITFSIYNVYGRRNPFSIFFRKENNRPPRAYRLSVLGSAFPSITYTFEFK